MAREVLWKTRAFFILKPGGNWVERTWVHTHGSKHVAIVEKARELGAVAWDFGQADHAELSRANF